MDGEPAGIVLDKKSPRSGTDAGSKISGLQLKLSRSTCSRLYRGGGSKGKCSLLDRLCAGWLPCVEQYRLNNERGSNSGAEHAGSLDLPRIDRQAIVPGLAAAIVESRAPAHPIAGRGLNHFQLLLNLLPWRQWGRVR